MPTAGESRVCRLPLRQDTAVIRPIVRAVVMLLAAPACLVAQRPLNARTTAGLDSIARATLATDRVAGLTIAVSRGTQPPVIRPYGKADLALNVATPENAVYEIGSVTKQFTAVAILQLVERGRLSLDAELSALLPNVRFTGPTVTLRRLLDHTSGIPGYTEMAEFGALMPQALPRDSLVRLIASKPRDFAPGDEMRYNNSAYFLLGLIIERASGMPYEQYVASELFKRAGMTRSRYCSNTAVVPGTVQGYDLVGTALQRARYLDQRWPYAGGSLCSTARDLLAWNAALHGGRLLTAASYRELLTPGTLTDGATTRYATGLVVNDSLAGRLAIHHGGAIPGFASAAAYVPGDSLTVVVLINTLGALNPTDLVEAVIRHVAGGQTLPPRAFAGNVGVFTGRYLGVSRAGRPGVLQVRAHPAGGLSVQVGGDSVQRAEWRGGDTFALSSTRVTFTRAQGRVTGARVDDVLNSHRYAREAMGSTASAESKAPALPSGGASRYVGRYELRDAPDKPALALRVFEEDGQLAGQVRTNTPSRLEFLGDDRFRPVDSPEFTVTFVVNIGFLSDIGFQVVEFEARLDLAVFHRDAVFGFRLSTEGAIAVRQNQLPVPTADGLEFVGVVVKEISLVRVLRLEIALQQRPNIQAINLVVWQFGVDEFGDRWQQINRHRRRVIGAARRDFSGPTRDEWHAHATFPRRAFALAQATRRSRVFAVGKPWTVVGRENHERIVIQLMLLDGVENFAHAPIHFLHDVRIKTRLR